jgi:hypothetical protein
MDKSQVAAGTIAWNILSNIAASLDLTETQHKLAKDRYKTVSNMLAESDHPLLAKAAIYSQGSFRIGTSVKPIGRDEFDIDLVCHIPIHSSQASSHEIYELVGKRLSEHETYKKILEPKNRCWRLNYAGEFHMDITPSTIDQGHSGDGEMVPDKALSKWKESNPKGYAGWVDLIDSISPSVAYYILSAEDRASVEPLPSHDAKKGILKKFIQLIKRSRDVYFDGHPMKDFAPISILLTTLASQAYRDFSRQDQYPSLLDLFIVVVEMMPRYIRVNNYLGKEYFEVPNPMHEEENFAERWNEDLRYKQAFYSWQRELLSQLNALNRPGNGIDGYTRTLKDMLGDRPVGTVMASVGDLMHTKKKAGAYGITSGLGVTSGIAHAVSPKPNTFFGN